MTDQTTSEPVAYALYEKAGKRRGEWVLVTHAVSARDRSVYDVRPLYAHPEPSEAADELEAMRIERDNWRMTAEEAMRAEKRWKECAVEAVEKAAIAIGRQESCVNPKTGTWYSDVREATRDRFRGYARTALLAGQEVCRADAS